MTDKTEMPHMLRPLPFQAFKNPAKIKFRLVFTNKGIGADDVVCVRGNFHVFQEGENTNIHCIYAERNENDNFDLFLQCSAQDKTGTFYTTEVPNEILARNMRPQDVKFEITLADIEELKNIQDRIENAENPDTAKFIESAAYPKTVDVETGDAVYYTVADTIFAATDPKGVKPGLVKGRLNRTNDGGIFGPPRIMMVPSSSLAV